MKYIYLYSYESPSGAMGVGYLPADSLDEVYVMLKQVENYDKKFNGFKFSIQEQIVHTDLIKEVVDNPKSIPFLTLSMYPRPSARTANQIVFGTYPGHLKLMDTVVKVPETYFEQMFNWLEKNEYYEICKELVHEKWF